MNLRLLVSANFLLPLLCRAAVVLSVDVNDAIDNPTDTAPGFADYELSDNTLFVGSYSIDINPANGAALDDVHRTTPATAGALTLGALYRDCVFAAGDNTANYYRVGLDTVIGGLTAGKLYTLTIWSYDSGSTGVRTSDWSVVGMGGPRWAANNYTFDGAVLPTADTANRFTVNAHADAAGMLILRGRPGVQSVTTQVFLNALTVDELAPLPVMATTVLALDMNDRSFAGAGYTAAGFSEFILDGTTTTQTTATRNYGPLTVTLAGVGVTVDDRERAGLPASSGAFTESALLRDFIFASSGAAGTGMDVTVGGLAANAQYLVELWSLDSGSVTTPRTSDWTVNGALLWDDYAFNGANLPATNNDYKMAGVFIANGSGQLVISGRLVVNAPAIFLNALRLSTVAPAPIVNFAHPIISEFMAENANGITDEDGATSDWIEIWNTTAATLDLAGWRLSDDPALISTPWVFPAGVSVPAQGLLRVWASGKNRTANPAALHTDFALKKTAGESLALLPPTGAAVTAFTNIPEQRANVSYGLFGSVEPQTAGYFQTPTPLAVNGVAPVPGFVADTAFDVKRGFFSTAQTVHITCATGGSTIYYTTDGSEPTTASAVVPGAGIAVTTTTVLRAKAFAPPLAPSNTDTQTYIFKAQVQNQPAAPAGWPATWGIDSQVDANDGAGNGTVPADYEMDPNVVAATLPGYGVTDALAQLPVLSVALNPADFHSVGAGIYTNPKAIGDLWEKACSFEMLEQDGTSKHTNCGIRVHGNSSRTPFRMQKHSFRFSFRSQYGDGKLDYKLFDETTVKQFDKLVLHAFFTDGYGLVSWDQARYRPETAVTFRDPFVKRCFADMGGARVSGKHLHVFINGLYWGVYEISERIDDSWCADHYGGLTTDWDVLAPDSTTAATPVKNGTAIAWDALFALVNTPDLTIQANYDAVAAQMDLVNFADYYLLHVHGDAEDWPHHNGYAIRNRVTPGAKWQFVPWDQEIAFDPLVLVDRLSPTATNTTSDKTFGRLYQKLRASPEFRLLLADRAHRHLHNGGALSLAVEQARWQSFVDLLDKPIVAESARWGDTADATPYGNAVLPANTTLTRENHWLPQVALVKNSHLPMLHNNANASATVTELRAQSPRLYPLTEPPAFSQFGGNVPANFALTVTAPAGQIYYTTNGADPRTAYSGAASGTLYTAPIVLAQTATVKARALNAGEWSALTEATYIVGTAAARANLTVSEINYNPIVADEEFIELTNMGGNDINLTGVHFEGITFTFPNGTLLAAGVRVVLARNAAVFSARYPSVAIAGIYTGSLDNAGEEIAVLAYDNTDIVRFTYRDKAPWPTAADGAGRSLILRAPSAAGNTDTLLSSAESWRSSAADGGNPGGTDTVAFTGNPLADLDSDGLPALLEYATNTADTAGNPSPVTVAFESFTVATVTASYLTLTTRAAPAADSAALTAEFSDDLITWIAGSVLVNETIASGGTITRKWRAAIPHPTGPRFARLKATQR